LKGHGFSFSRAANAAKTAWALAPEGMLNLNKKLNLNKNLIGGFLEECLLATW